MKEIVNKIRSFKSVGKGKLPKNQAQSLVEFAIALPVLILLLLGMVEFGFMLNTYLSLQDASRAVARRYSTVNPFNSDGTDNTAFFTAAAQNVVDTLAPSNDPGARQIPVDTTRDNILISLIEITVDTTTDPNTITTITRHPTGFLYYKLYSDTDPASAFSDTSIGDFLTANGADPVNSGLLIVEIYYSYEGVINSPITTPFLSDANPVMLYVSSTMPTTYAKPINITP